MFGNLQGWTMTVRKVAVKKGFHHQVVLYNPGTGGYYKATFETATEAREHHREMAFRLGRHRQSSTLNRKTTVAQLLEAMLESKPKLRPHTREGYRYSIDELVGQIGNQRVASLDSGLYLSAVLNAIEERSGSNRRHACEAMLREMLSLAVDEGLLFVSPLKRTKMAKRPLVRGKPYDPTMAEMVRLYEYVGVQRKGGVLGDTEMNQAVLATLIGTGMRPSELVALAVEDIDPDARTIHVQRQLHSDKEHGLYFAPLKPSGTGYPDRMVPVPRFVLQALATNRLRNGVRTATLPWIEDQRGPLREETHTMVFFSLRDHTKLYPAPRLQGLLTTISPLVGPPINARGIRHAHATRLNLAGVPQINIDAMTGHLPKGSITEIVYTHPTPEGDEKARQALQEMWRAAHEDGGPETLTAEA
jgi:integrase